MKKVTLLSLLAFIASFCFAQNIDLSEVKPGRFDQGKMWTFENPPVQYFEEAYGFTPTEEWLNDVRQSSLRFASWCSASFISENGLIMTNHHCSRGVTASVMNEGENFDENGFYAASLEAERRVPDLYVDQMVMIANVTQQVADKANASGSPEQALEEIKAEYQQKEEWEDLIIETRTFYSGGQYSLYGFKRYPDIRLVLYPELALGYYGGDPDNFTYPRYNLDFTFFRAYDEDGKPLKPSNYFSFKPAGAEEGEAVFVIGNPGSTGRYLTMSQLYFQRDTSVPAVLAFLRNRKDILLKAAELEEDIYVKDSITNLAFSLSNSDKAYTGRLKGLNNDYLMTKKELKEHDVRANVSIEGDDPWNNIAMNESKLSAVYADMLLLTPQALRGKVNLLAHKLAAYQSALSDENQEGVTESEKELRSLITDFDTNLERALFVSLLNELKDHSRGGFIHEQLGDQSAYDYAAELLENSLLLSNPDKFFKLKADKLSDKEPLMSLADKWPGRYMEAATQFQMVSAENKSHEEKIMNMQFQLSGATSPPDATFSLRIADGKVKRYEYNGTTAPYKTTYFGLYNRHYSNDGEFPWQLPERWKNPTMDLLKQPLNFISTNDIIGGNSGSPVINKNAEVVGLVFDGNIESLPGYFIFDEESNRTVSVHAGGIAAAVKYVYKAERLLKELNVAN
ncbi:MAG: S46 family peptidase [Cyclobacteriaceae bacterium]